MINKPSIFISNTFDPYTNLATEEYFLEKVDEGQIVLYLWRNERTVVVGRNQNIFAEVNLDALKAMDGNPTRRLSGGGAVYHDDGNLNFTFVCRSGDFDVDRQTTVVLDAVRNLGFNAEKTGRNDLCIGGRKFSGHSYFRASDRCFHNGTILIRTDAAAMASVLNVSATKLASKGVKSVRSRTVNLSEIDASTSLESVVASFKACFAKEYGSPEELVEPYADPLHALLREKFISDEWIFNRKLSWNSRWEGRSPEGNVSVLMDVRNGVIADCAVYSDALDPGYSADVRNALLGKPYKKVNFEEIVTRRV